MKNLKKVLAVKRTVLGQTYTFPDSKNSVLSVYAAIKF